MGNFTGKISNNLRMREQSVAGLLFQTKEACEGGYYNVQRLKAWLPVSSQPTNIMQRKAFRGHSTKYKCLENFALYGRSSTLEQYT